MKIGQFSVSNPVLVNILMVALLTIGTLTIYRMPKEQFPAVPFYFVNITVPWIGVSAEEIEQQIAIPVEEEMQGLDNVESISSFSTEGMGMVNIWFDDGISQNKFDKLHSDVNTRLARVKLPDDALDSSVNTFSSNDFAPVIEIVLSGDVGYDELVKSAEQLTEPLRRIEEVDDVSLIGVRDKQIVLSTDRAALEARSISLDEFVRVLKAKNVNVPGGTLSTDTRNYLVRTVGAVSNITAFGEIILRQATDATGLVRIRDVAQVVNEYDRNGQRVRLDGKTAVTLRVAKVPKGNSIRIIEDVRAVMEKWDSRISDDITISFLNDSSSSIKTSIRILLNNAMFGLVFLIIILYLFIGFRNAVIAALGIPVTFAITFILLEASGQTFNGNTLFGMVLVLGLIVDHAIVITENSFRYRQQGLSLHDAAIKGTNQVAIPVIAATATTVAAFLPLMIVPGTMGKFLRVIPFTVAIALAVSTAEALVFLPSHYADWPVGKRGLKKERIFGAFRRAFRHFSEIIYKRRKLTVLLTLVFMVASFGLIPLLQFDLFSGKDRAVFYVDITMPPGTPIERTDQVTAKFEEKLIPLIGNGEISAISTSIGFLTGESGNAEGSTVAQLVVDLTETGEGRERSITAIVAEVRTMTEGIAGPDKVLFRKAVDGPPTDPPFSFRLFGDRYAELILIAARIRDELAREETVFNVEDNYETGTPELVVRVKEERAASYGLSVSSIGNYLRASVEGIAATTFFKDNETLDVLVRFSDSRDFSPSILSQLRIPTSTGMAIPFSTIASVESGESLATIKRYDGRREVTVTAETYTKESIRAVNARIKAMYESEFASRYPNVEFSIGGEFAEFNNLLSQILRLFLVGIFLIYIILGTQFKSYVHPFLIMFSVPLSFSGVLIFLIVTGTLFSIPVIYAGVALAGIAVNDAIVLISFINERRREGASTRDAILTASETRLRPILLTSLTTIAGLAPTALGLGGDSPLWGSMAGTIIFGLLFSTLATLVFIPAFYGTMFDRKPGKKAQLTEAPPVGGIPTIPNFPVPPSPP